MSKKLKNGAIFDTRFFNRRFSLKGARASVMISNRGKGHKRLTIVLDPARLFYPDAETIDHINRNPLDCRKANLRPATRRQQVLNQPPRGKSKYRGVNWKPRIRRWTATADEQYIGCFKYEDDAARARDAYIKNHYSAADLKFAVLNEDIFPELKQRKGKP